MKSSSVLPEPTTQRPADRESIGDLDWSKLSSGSGAPIDIQKSLTIQSDALNTEIIDFLLQWEEGDVGIGINSLSAAFDAKRLQETYEVLDALNHVDKELEEVDGWLMEQIQCLSLIQSRLVVIEKESGTLEKGYQNLKSIQEMTESLVLGLSLSSEDERVLSTKPEQVLEAAYKQNSFDDTAEIISPLLSALRNIKKALALTGGEVPGISIRQWKQLQSLTAVSKQRQKLVELSKFFCNKFAPFLCGVFGAVLKHRSLHEQAAKRVKKQRIHGVEIKHFSFEVAIDDGLKFSRMLTNATDRALFGTRKTDGSSSQEPPLTLRPNKDINEDNVALHAQSNYHEALGGFVPLLELVLELSTSTVVSLSTAYVTSSAERFYVPLFRVLFQHLRLLVISSKGSVGWFVG